VQHGCCQRINVYFQRQSFTMTNITAIVIGATGATGKQIVNQLLDDNSVTTVKIFVRKTIALVHPKLETFVVDFDAVDTWQHLITGNILLSAMGTTLKQAGSKAAQYKVDVTYQYQVAKAAVANGVSTALLLSAYGANASSAFFYPKMKGELEAMFINLGFKSLHIFQPGILERFANDGRVVERLSVKLIKAFNAIGLFRSQTPMPVAVLAAKMIKVATNMPVEKLCYYRLGDIFKL
jgi:uncharacterized protein YbjT (DUF2867 family)